MNLRINVLFIPVKEKINNSLFLQKRVSVDDFAKRLRHAFRDADNKTIASKLGVTAAAVSNYFNGRIPDAEKLLLIAQSTNCNLHWLLTGEESPTREIVVERKVIDPIIDREVLRGLIREVMREEMAVQDLGRVDGFDLDAEIERGGGDAEILGRWFEAEGRELPPDFLGMLPKVEGGLSRRAMLQEMKKVLDRTLWKMKG